MLEFSYTSKILKVRVTVIGGDIPQPRDKVALVFSLVSVEVPALTEQVCTWTIS